MRGRCSTGFTTAGGYSHPRGPFGDEGAGSDRVFTPRPPFPRPIRPFRGSEGYDLVGAEAGLGGSGMEAECSRRRTRDSVC
jgi:hypothetical protein